MKPNKTKVHLGLEDGGRFSAAVKEVLTKFIFFAERKSQLDMFSEEEVFVLEHYYQDISNMLQMVIIATPLKLLLP